MNTVTDFSLVKTKQQAAWGAGDSYQYSNFIAKIFFALVLKNLYIDKRRRHAGRKAVGQARS